MSDIREAAFVAPTPTINGEIVRPITAGSLILLKRTGNKIIEGQTSDLPERDLCAFLFIHTQPVEQVRRACATADAFDEAVQTYAETLPIKELVKAGSVIKQLAQDAAASMDYEVEGDASPK